MRATGGEKIRVFCDFRDPKVLWACRANNGDGIMAYDRAKFYTSPDLKKLETERNPENLVCPVMIDCGSALTCAT